MLPEFPEITDHLLARARDAMMRARDSKVSPFENARHVECFEGDSHGGHSVPDIPFQEFCEEILFRKAEVMDLQPDDVFRKFEQAGEKLGAEIASHHFGIMRGVSEATDCIVESGDDSEPLIEQVFRMMEKVRWSFDEHGRPDGMMFVAGQEMAAKLAAVNEEIENSSEVCQRREAIINRKREEWRAAQANRKLVD